MELKLLTKEERWNAVAKQVVSSRPHPIDAGILDTVIALNLLGVTTIYSSDGE